MKPGKSQVKNGQDDGGKKQLTEKSPCLALSNGLDAGTEHEQLLWECLRSQRFILPGLT
jgi:hypothetical protein